MSRLEDTLRDALSDDRGPRPPERSLAWVQDGVRRQRRRRATISAVSAVAALTVGVVGLTYATQSGGEQNDSITVAKPPPVAVAFRITDLSSALLGTELPNALSVVAPQQDQLRITVLSSATCTQVPLSVARQADGRIDIALVTYTGPMTTPIDPTFDIARSRVPLEPVACGGDRDRYTSTTLTLGEPMPDELGQEVEITDSTGAVYTSRIGLPGMVRPSLDPCPTEPGNQAASFVDQIRFGGADYDNAGSVPSTGEVGPQLSTIRCRLADTVSRLPLQDGDAYSVPVDSPVLEAVGFDPRFRVLVRDAETGELDRYERLVEPIVPGTGADVLPGLRDRVRDVVVISTSSGRALRSVGDQRQELIDALFGSPYDPQLPKAGRTVPIGLDLDDGTRVVLQYDPTSGVVVLRPPSAINVPNPSRTTQPGMTLPDDARAIVGAALN